jgi:16S rRNA (uracil1498-N3)-methyltransferase
VVTSPRPGGTAPHVLVADVEQPVLDPADRHHLSRVRRLRAGDELTVTDGQGRWRWCRFRADDEPEPIGEAHLDVAPEPVVTVAFALVKGQRPELVVQKLTELGVDRIVPFVAERSVVRWDEAKSQRQADRLDGIARAAAMQSRRTRLAVVEPVATFDEVAGRPGACGADLGGAPPSLAWPCVLVGPEGGWSAEERDRLARTVELGPQVLRAETAAIVAGALLTGLRSGVVGEGG